MLDGRGAGKATRIDRLRQILRTGAESSVRHDLPSHAGVVAFRTLFALFPAALSCRAATGGAVKEAPGG